MKRTTASSPDTFSPKERNRFLLGVAGQNIIYSLITATFAYYLQFTLLIPAMAVGAILTASRIWDTVNDPLMGIIMDRTHTRWGKARPYLLFMPLPISILTVLCFVNGFYDSAQGAASVHNVLVVAWACLIYLLWGVAFTSADIPLAGLPSLMTKNADDRTRLLSLRIVGAMAGSAVLLAAQPAALAGGKLLAPVVGSDAKGERLGFLLVVVLFTIPAYLLFQQAGLGTKERVLPARTHAAVSENFRVMWRNRPFRRILLSGILGSPKFLVDIALTPLVTYYYASKSPQMTFFYMLILGAGPFLGQLLAAPLTPKLTRICGKPRLFILCNLMAILPNILVFLLYLSFPTQMAQPALLLLTAACLFAAGVYAGISKIVSSLLIADAVDYEESQHGLRPDGAFFSGQTLLAKLSAAIAAMLGGLAYSAVGFSGQGIDRLNAFIAAGGIPREMPEFTPLLMILFFLCTIPTAVGSLLCILPMRHYPLSDEKHAQILHSLEEKRSQAGV